MASGDDHAIENLIRGSQKLMRELVETGTEEPDAARLAADIAANIQKEEMAALDTLETPPTDGRVEVSVSKDAMIAYATFHPPTEDRASLARDDVQKALDKAKVSTGIDWETITEAIHRCNTEKAVVGNVAAARGTAPTSAMPPFLIISRELKERRETEDTPDGRIDFRERTPFTLVKKGDELAAWTLRREGRMGTSVRGVAVAYAKGTPTVVKPGKNTVEEGRKILAACDGRFQFTSEAFWVDEVLGVTGDVDYHTGNIDFPGDVIIEGDIRDGFNVKAGRSVFCRKSIEASRIDCRGDLITGQGVIGRRQAVIRVGGGLRAKFVEGCYIDAAGPILVQTSIMNSSVHTLDRVRMGDRGIIVGGLIYAQNGVWAAQVGTDRSPRTEIHCGIDYRVEQKLAWIRDKTIGLAMKLKEIETRMKGSPESAGRLGTLHGEVSAAIQRMNAQSQALAEKQDSNDKAEVLIRETVFPGTYIEICHVPHLVTLPMRCVVFRLDRAKGKIMASRLEKRPGPASG